MNIRLDTKFIIVVLLVIIAGMLVAWRPWTESSKRTITVTGTATVRQAPDEFVFTPSYTASADTNQAAVSKVSETGNAVVAKLKELGTQESELKTDVNSGYGYPMPLDVESSKPSYVGSTTAYYTITATVHNKELAQKILNYLVTTNTTYAVTPQSTLSKDARKKLENEARTKALVDARAKAVTTAESVGAKLGLVVSVSELSGGGPIYALEDTVSSSPTMREKATTAPVLLTGEQDLDFSVQVVYQIR